MPEAANFRMSFVAADSEGPLVEFRWCDEALSYRLDLVAGTLTKIADNKPTLLAQAKMTLLKREKESWPPRPLNWSAFEIIARNGSLQVRVAPDGKSWQDAMTCEDAAPISSGANRVLGAGGVE